MSLVESEVGLELKRQLGSRMPQVLFEQWFAHAEIMSWDGSRLELGVQNRFFKSRIESNYLDVLREAATAVLGRDIQVAVSVSPKLLAAFRKSQTKAKEEVAELGLTAELVPPPAPKPTARHIGCELNPDFTFDAFVVGSSNRLSHAVALRAVEDPIGFSRIYLCGQHGVGKTHLLQAVCHAVKAKRPEASVAYVTAERFVADLSAAYSAGTIRDFRAAYRNLDVLAFDEVQVLGVGSKAGSKAELIGIIDDLDAKGKQVLFASTSYPTALEGVEDQLRDRLRAGFVDQLLLPDMDTRRQLVVRKLAERELCLPGEAVDLLARELTGNVRKLEGSVLRLAALIQIENMQPTTNCIRMALEVAKPASRTSALTYMDVIKAVAEEFGVAAEAITGRGRAAPIRKARQLAVALCRHVVGGRLTELGEAFGNRSHATIISILGKISPEYFSDGLESRPVERILFRLGVSIKPQEIIGRQKGLFD